MNAHAKLRKVPAVDHVLTCPVVCRHCGPELNLSLAQLFGGSSRTNISHAIRLLVVGSLTDVIIISSAQSWPAYSVLVRSRPRPCAIGFPHGSVRRSEIDLISARKIGGEPTFEVLVGSTAFAKPIRTRNPSSRDLSRLPAVVARSLESPPCQYPCTIDASLDPRLWRRSRLYLPLLSIRACQAGGNAALLLSRPLDLSSSRHLFASFTRSLSCVA